MRNHRSQAEIHGASSRLTRGCVVINAQPSGLRLNGTVLLGQTITGFDPFSEVCPLRFLSIPAR
jgi:hypothetical protein